MGWAVGWDSDHNRWMGYGVPAYCDATDCGAEIDRGIAWRCACDLLHPSDPLERPNLFTCSNHFCEDVDEDNLPPEHPNWIKHLLTDESWAQWRAENPEQVKALTA